tara:strand:- start:72 stop:203 length:132 start_codon:yes stop_codon:yes gene_type:complete
VAVVAAVAVRTAAATTPPQVAEVVAEQWLGLVIQPMRYRLPLM